MSITDKLATIAANESKMYEAGGREERKRIFNELDEALVEVGAEPVESDDPLTPIDLFINRAYEAGRQAAIDAYTGG